MYSSADKERAIELRLLGRSYGDIRKELGIRSKGTLSVWFKELMLTEEAKKLLERNIQYATKRKLLLFNEQRSERIRKENQSARDGGKNLIGNLSRRDLLVVGAALYWGEGTKSEGTSSYNSLAFSNSDPEMIKIFLRFLREILKIPEGKIYASIHMYESMSEIDTRTFWKTCTGLDEDKLTVSYQVSRAGKSIRKPLPYGTLNIKVHNRLVFNTVKGMIEGIASR
jgi:transposase-like protein